MRLTCESLTTLKVAALILTVTRLAALMVLSALPTVADARGKPKIGEMMYLALRVV